MSWERDFIPFVSRLIPNPWAQGSGFGINQTIENKHTVCLELALLIAMLLAAKVSVGPASPGGPPHLWDLKLVPKDSFASQTPADGVCLGNAVELLAPTTCENMKERETGFVHDG